jgi:hypothetical protein
VNFLSITSSKTHMSSCMMTLAKIRSRSHAGDLASGKVAVCFDPGQTMVWWVRLGSILAIVRGRFLRPAEGGGNEVMTGSFDAPIFRRIQRRATFDRVTVMATGNFLVGSKLG